MLGVRLMPMQRSIATVVSEISKKVISTTLLRVRFSSNFTTANCLRERRKAMPMRPNTKRLPIIFTIICATNILVFRRKMAKAVSIIRMSIPIRCGWMVCIWGPLSMLNICIILRPTIWKDGAMWPISLSPFIVIPTTRICN